MREICSQLAISILFQLFDCHSGAEDKPFVHLGEGAIPESSNTDAHFINGSAGLTIRAARFIMLFPFRRRHFLIIISDNLPY